MMAVRFFGIILAPLIGLTAVGATT